jgi:oxygen-independent coproporphyrinogen-3 oxidase
MLKTYREAAGSGLLASARGIKTNADDRARQQIIEHIMCGGHASFEHLSESARTAARTRLAPFEQDGLVHVQGDTLSVTGQGRLFTRLICTAFDNFWEETSTRHAKAI